MVLPKGEKHLTAVGFPLTWSLKWCFPTKLHSTREPRRKQEARGVQNDKQLVLLLKKKNKYTNKQALIYQRPSVTRIIGLKRYVSD